MNFDKNELYFRNQKFIKSKEHFRQKGLDRSSEEGRAAFRTRLFGFFLRLYSRTIARSRQGRTIWYRRKHLINSQLAALRLGRGLKNRFIILKFSLYF